MSGLVNILSSNSYFIVNKTLCKKLGLTCAVIIGELYSEYAYWEKQGKLVDGGYFYCTRNNLQENTCLSPYEQRKAINKLIEHEILTTKLKGIPAVTYYKINENKLMELLELQTDTDTPSSNPSCEKISQQYSKDFNINNNNNNNNINTHNTIINNSITRTRTACDSSKKLVNKSKTKKSKKDTFMDKFLDICSEYEFSETVLTELQKFANMLAEMNTYSAEETIRQQLQALVDNCLTDKQRVKVINDTIIRGWKSLIYCISNSNANKSCKDDRANWDPDYMSNEQSSIKYGSEEFNAMVQRGEIEFY